MTKVVTVAPGYSQVPLPDGNTYNPGPYVTLSDVQYAAIPGSVLSQLILISSSPDQPTPHLSSDAYTAQVVMGVVGPTLAEIETNISTNQSSALQKSSNLSDLVSSALARTNLGLAPIAASGSATDLTTGTLSQARLPDLSGTYARADMAVNVKKYGATGDGVTDDTASIASAIAALTPGAELWFPAGTYLVSQVLLASVSNFAIRGSGATLLGSDVTKAVLRLTSCSHFEVTGLRVRHQSASVRNSSGHGINLVTCSDYYVSRNEVAATAASGILSAGGTDGSVVGNTIANTLADGIHHTGGSTRITVALNKLYTTGDDAVAVVGYQVDSANNSDVTITGNVVVQSKARGIAIVGCDGATVAGNTVDATTAAGIYVAQESSYNTRQVSKVTVSGNTITGANTYNSPGSQLAGIHIAGSSNTYPVKNILIIGNNISGSGWRDIEVTATTQGNVSMVGVANNQCDQNAVGPSIDVTNGLDVAIERNLVRYANGSGINIVTGSDRVMADFNSIYKPNQANSGTNYGVVNNATTGSTVFNVVTPDGTKAALLATSISSDASGNINANQNITGNQVISGAATRSVILTGPNGTVVARNDGGVAWVADTNAGAGTIDTGLARDAAGVVRVTDGSSGTKALKTSVVLGAVGGAYVTAARVNSGEYVTAQGLGGNSFTGTLLNNSGYFVPIDIPVGFTANLIGLNVTGAGVGTGPVARFGIFSDSGSNRPGTLLLDAGTVDISTTGNKTIAISQAVSAGRIWLCVAPQGCNTTAPVVSVMRGALPGIAWIGGAPATNGGAAFSATGISGALASNPTLTGTGSDAPLAYLRSA